MPPTLVSFPAEAVDAAIGECRRMATHVDGVGEQVDSSATVARGEWRGGHRDDFDVVVGSLVPRHSDLATQLRNLAGALEEAKLAVAREDQRRVEAFAEAEAAERCRAPRGAPTPC